MLESAEHVKRGPQNTMKCSLIESAYSGLIYQAMSLQNLTARQETITINAAELV